MIKVVVLVRFYNGELSPFDESALECALKIKDALITVVSMSQKSDIERLEYLTRLGIDAVLISDEMYAGSDTLITSKILTKEIKNLQPDLILCGRKSLCGDTGQVPPQIAFSLGYKFIPNVMNFAIDFVNTRLGNVKVNFPCLMTVEKIDKLRSASIFSKKRDVILVDNTKLNFNFYEVGINGSPTKVVSTYENKREKSKCEFICFDELDSIISKSLLKNRINNIAQIENKFEEVYYKSNSIKEIAQSISKNIVELKKEGIELADEILQTGAEIVLFPSNDEYKNLASMIAKKINIGLSADCIKFDNYNGKLLMYRPAVGGKTIARIISNSKIQMATVKVNYPSKDVIFGVGYGAVSYLNEIKKLAKKYDAEIVATRKVVDSGFLPYESQVGLTGKMIAPKVYVAFGISGAIQHIVGVENSQTIIAINKDKNESIFDYANYGIIKNL